MQLLLFPVALLFSFIDIGTAHAGFFLTIAPILENNDGAQYNVRVQCAQKKSTRLFSLRTSGTVAFVQTDNACRQQTKQYRLAHFYSLKVTKIEWNRSTSSFIETLSFEETNIRIDNNDIYTFFMGSHFFLRVEPDLRFRPFLFPRCKYRAEVYCAGETGKRVGYKSVPTFGTFNVFLAEKNCDVFDVQVRKVLSEKPHQTVAKRTRIGIPVARGETIAIDFGPIETAQPTSAQDEAIPPQLLRLSLIDAQARQATLLNDQEKEQANVRKAKAESAALARAQRELQAKEEAQLQKAMANSLVAKEADSTLGAQIAAYRRFEEAHRQKMQMAQHNAGKQRARIL